ncbi:MAG TPA: YciK family oxidoreductase [Gammaproteobacteria bacterium]|jgi:NAD(P)-dependent dehydrogenase (short-subunit alcohol dehydrogenase family)|nr:YciK family oxidoreductase [Gammaproteobacteria bacterium]
MIQSKHDYAAAKDLLKGRVILVTGAGDGIGRAVSKGLAAHGATVVLLGKTIKKLESVYDELLALGAPKPAIYPMDLMGARYKDYEDMVGALDKEYGRLDGLLHNAGILGERAPIEHHEVHIWQQVLQVNLTAPFMLTKACLELLYKSPDASVVFTSSGVGRKARAYWGAYSVSKFGIEALSTTLADETEFRKTLRVNSINPGPVRTEMRRLAFPAEDREQLAAPESILATYLYLLGPDSQGVTGQQFDAQRPG